MSFMQSSIGLTLYLIETPFSAFTNKADPDQAAFILLASGPDKSFLCSMYNCESLFI